jgi:S-(hydroxymethyl)glutathione dehydrogenase/alcohol dehydrogenase
MAIKCKAAIADGKGGFIFDEIEVAAPQPDEVLIKTKAAGICHTDYDSLQWGKPLALGHEGAGVVARAGKEVEHLKEGDSVILNWATPCGHCFQCLTGNPSICDKNSPVAAGNNGPTPGHAVLSGTKWKGEPLMRSFNLGTLSEYMLVKSSAAVLNHSSAMSFPAASIIGCGVMTGYGSVVNIAKVEAGASVVVLGAGGVGLNVIQGAKIAGAAHVLAIDVNKNRLAMAAQFGATDLITADKEDSGLLNTSQKVWELLGRKGADYAFECTGVPELGAAPLLMVRNGGSAVQVSGIEQELTIDMKLFEWNKTYINPLYGGCRPQIDFPKIIDQYDQGNLLLEELITRTYELSELGQAFDDMLKGRNAKGVIVFP